MAFSPDQAFEKLDEAHRRQRLAHAYLVSGPPGSGKEALVCRLVGSFGGTPAPAALEAAAGRGVHVLRPMSKSRRIKVAQVHELESALRLTSSGGMPKVGVVVDADRMMEQAQNAFLKTLEEPPPNCLIFLLSPYPEQLLPTILSRCIGLELREGERLAHEPASAAGQLLDLLAAQGTLEQRGVRPALRLARAFGDLLDRCEKEIEGRYDQMLAEEKAQFQKTTGPSDWADDRSEAVKGMVQADYLAVRARLHGLLLSWFADAARLKAGSPVIDLPESRAALEKLAAAEDMGSLLRRLGVDAASLGSFPDQCLRRPRYRGDFPACFRLRLIGIPPSGADAAQGHAHGNTELAPGRQAELTGESVQDFFQKRRPFPQQDLDRLHGVAGLQGGTRFLDQSGQPSRGTSGSSP